MTPITQIVLVPAFNPTEEMLHLVDKLLENNVCTQIIVIDDGSNEQGKSFLKRIEDKQSVTILRHAQNKGKGAALKTAFAHILKTFPDDTCVVTADADGQHRWEDIINVLRNTCHNRDGIVLGVRVFDKTVPFRSRFGNRLTSRLIKWLTGATISDTQTGLRGIPAKMLPSFVSIAEDRYEFELAMLLLCIRQNIRLIETPIKTIYINDNKGSHFNPISDSFRIYSALFRLWRKSRTV